MPEDFGYGFEDYAVHSLTLDQTLAGSLCIIVTVISASSRVSGETPAAPEAGSRSLGYNDGSNPEFDLLCACCGEQPGEKRRVLQLLQGPINWQELIGAADHHAIVPRLYQFLQNFSHEVPPEAFTSIRALYQSNLQRTLWLTRELGRIISRLAKLDIPALPYKGPALAQSLYGDISGRQFSDLDILVQRHDVTRAKKALLELGFQPQLALTQLQEQSYVHSGYELTFDSPGARNLLELQWQVLPRFYAVDFDMESFFRRAVKETVAGISLRSLSAEDLLLILCVHAAKHAWIQLSWLCDVAQLGKQNNLRWEFVLHEAQHLGVERIVGVTFVLAHRLLRNPLPAAVRVDSEAEALADQVVPLIASSRHFETESMQYLRLIARTRERPRDRARFWWRLATTPGPGEWKAVQLPSALFPLYRIIRPFRAARRLLPLA